MTQQCMCRPYPNGRPPPAVGPMWLSALLLFAFIKSGEAAIQFTSKLYNASVPENALGNTVVVSDEKMGFFLEDPSLKIKFRIIDGDPGNLFKSNARVVGDFCFLEVSVRTGSRKVLNSESTDSYLLQIKAQQKRYDKTKEDILGVNTQVYIKITDLNDLTPFFLERKYEVLLSEDAPLYKSIIKVRADDPDSGLNGQVYFSFQNPTQVFIIHPTTGVVSLTRKLDKTKKSHYELTVVARDRGLQLPGSNPSTALLVIYLTEVNIYKPTIKVTKLSEPQPSGHLMINALINIYDRDQGSSGKVKSIEVWEGDSDKVFRIIPGSSPNEFLLASLNNIKWEDAPYGFNLSLKVSDDGSRPRSSFKPVRISPPQMQLQEPIFTQKEYEVEIIESAPPGSRVVGVSTWLPGTQTKISFSIIAGNEGGHFHVDAKSGVLFTARLLDADVKDIYSITLTATTSGIFSRRQQKSAKVIIKIADANDFTPIIVAPQGVVTVEEHQNQGSWVTQVRAQDYDSGENKRVSYSLANIESVPFVIDHFTGDIRTSKSLDYETEKRLWKLKVRVSDWGMPFRRQSEKTILVKVLDVNDNRPQFEYIQCTGYIDRSAPLGTEVYTLSAIDFDEGNIISYRILSGNNDRCFTLDSSSGILTLTCDLQDFVISERYLNVTATDGQHFADTMSIRLQLLHQRTTSGSWADLDCKGMGITQKLQHQLSLAAQNNPIEDDINFRMITPPPPPNEHPPEVFVPRIDIRMRENSDPGRLVYHVEAHDIDEGYDGYLMYSIINGNEDSVFNIEMNTGNIVVAGLLDRETTARYLLNISISDCGAPRRSISQLVAVTIVDENDNAPKFDKAAYNFFIPENVANGTSVYQLIAFDPDEGRNGAITYNLETDTRDFYLNPVTGRLSVSRPLDYEKINIYELRIAAMDGRELSSYAYVTVELFDMNDCPPVFPNGDSMTVRVPEDLPVGALVTLVSASDADSTDLHYTLEAGNERVFDLDPITSALRLIKPLDYEMKPTYNLTVRATDNDQPPLSAQTFVIVQLVDVNENIHSPVFGQDVLEAKIREDAKPHTLVTSAPARDGDLSFNPSDASISYSIMEAEAQGLFYIDSKGDIYTSAWLDRETQSRYWLTVRATDSGTIPLHATLHVYIEIEDVNDNRPLSVWPVYWPAILENSAANTHVSSVVASDPDLGADEGAITYSIIAGNPQSFFRIDAKSGEIRTTERRLDREHSDEHSLEILITDDDDPKSSLSSTAYVIISVTDENDNAPEFFERIYKISAPVYSRNEKRENVVGQVLAMDSDSGANGEVTYTIEGDDWLSVFRIDPKSGVIYAIVGLDISQHYKLTVQAYDGGRPVKRSTCLVVITPVEVTERSLHAPRLLGGSRVKSSVLEDDPIGHLVQFIHVDDEDADKLWFEIIAGNDENAFAIGRENGNIVIAKSLDAERKTSYNLTVAVTDGVHMVTCEVNVTVIDVNDNRPSFSLPNYSIEVGENTSPGTTIHTLVATDKDTDKVLTFSLVNTAHVASESKFTVNPSSGDIVLKQPLDREVQHTHVLTVAVKDRISPIKSSFARVTITVRDYNDHLPEFVSRSYRGVVTETTLVGATILQVMAVDKDYGANGHVTYSIVSGNIGGTFSLDPESGLMSLARTVNMNQIPEYWLSIKGSDDGNPPKYSHVNVKIIVKMERDTAPRFTQKEYLFEISESARVGSYLGTLAPESHLGVFFSLHPGQGQLPFVINPSSGILYLDKTLDFEKTQSYNMTVLAVSMNGKESSVFIVVSVKDENDNAPQFLQILYEGHIVESAAVDSAVLMKDSRPLVVSAKDVDSEQNSNLVYDILDEEARSYFSIDSTTGAIRSLMLFDHEVMASLNFSVSVRDSGRPRLTAPTNARVSISISDINDVPPQFLQQEYNSMLLLPTHKGVSVVQLEATDLDFDGKANLVFTIVAGNEDEKFRIDSKNGLISVNESKDMKDSYKFKVTVSDGQFASSTSVKISCESVSRSGLRFARDKYFASVDENSTAIENIVMVNVLGSDINEHLRFRILNPTEYFEIRETSGVIRTTGIPFDREERENCIIIVEARSSKASKRVVHVPVHVVVVDKNDNSPIFVNTPYYGIVPIDTKKGSVIFKVRATDFDSGDNSRVRYELRKGNGELFSVKRSSGEIILRQSLKGIAINHELTITAYDAGNPPLHSQVDVRLKIVDRSQPIFEKQFYSATVAENAELYTPIITMEAISQLNRKIIYTFINGNQDYKFAMEYEEGIVTVNDELDFENQSSYQLSVRAIDTFTGKYAQVTLSIQLIDSNDNAPKFIQSFYNVSVSEAAAVASPLLQVMSTDPDSGSNAGVSYQLQGLNETPPENFYMESSSGMLMLKKALDRETRGFHHFLVIATDTGTPPLSSTTQIYIKVVDMNDNAPEFSQPSFRCGLSEGASRGQFVSLISAFDKDDSDKENLIYSIVSGNDLQAFNIGASTGIVRVWNHQRVIMRSEHFLNISVTDGVFTAYTRLAIDSLPLNSHSPIFQSPKYSADIAENSAPETFLTSVVASDEDSGRYGDVTYHFVGDEVQKFFRLNENTGDIWCTRPLDREERSEYSYTVMAMDIGGKSAFTHLFITVTDENDNQPLFSKNSFNAIIRTNATEGTPIIKISAYDLDADENGKVHYRFHESTPEKLQYSFSLHAESGQLTLDVDAAELGDKSTFEFFIDAVDGGSKPLHSSVAVLIRVVNYSTHLPEFLSTEYTFAIKENSAIGSKIGTIKARYDRRLEYSIDWGRAAPPPLGISFDGTLSLRSQLDYEREPKFSVVISANPYDLPELVGSTIVNIEVQDVNDESPIFESDKYYVSVAENTPVRSNIIKVSASDKDSGRNSKLRYLIDETNLLEEEPLFALDPYSGWLSLNKKLDFELHSSYELKIIAMDNGTPSLKSTASIFLQVVDYNDNPPIFSLDKYRCSVREDALPGTVVMKLEVSDDDSDLEENLKFYIIDGNDRQNFHVRRGGQIYVSQPLDRETVEHYLLTVIVTDGVFVSSTQVYVQILDVNDNAPLCTHPFYSHVISEHMHPGTLILQISSLDPDLVDPPQYYLSGEGSEYFKMDVSSGQLSVHKHLDRETVSRYNLIATVRDGGHHDWQCKCSILIEITDVNDNPPKFSQNIYNINVPENSPRNLIMMKIHASDPDLGLNRKVSYTLEGSNKFAIDRYSGILSTTKSLDREKQAMYNLTVIAHDHGHPRLSSKTSVLVLVADMNDNPPEFASHTYYITIMESTNVGSDIVRVLATSRDTGANAEIRYDIIGGNEHRKFTIHPSTGVVSIKDHLDYERGNNFLLTIQAKDGGVPPLSNHATVNVTITDINDNQPVFIQNSYSAIVNEAAPANDKLIQVVATDQDSGVNGQLTYAIAGGDPHTQFHVDKYNGWISVIRPLDRESISTYTLDILALDRGIPQRTGTVSVYIEVMDANDNPPVFIVANNTAYVQEDKAEHYLVFRFEVTDDDSDRDRNGAPFTFEIVSGNSNDAFRISADGDLRTAIKFNHRVKDLYKLRIRVFDNGRPPLMAETWINVKIIEESQFAPNVFPLDVVAFIKPGSYRGGLLGRIRASDEDPYDALSFSIVPNGKRFQFKYFNIDKKSGVISANTALDGGSYSINVSVTDGKFTTYDRVNVEMIEIDEEIVESAAIIRLKGASPEEFLLSFRRAFHRSMKAIFSVRSRDVVIISIQDPKAKRHKREKYSPLYPTFKEGILDILFVVKKTNSKYLPRAFVRRKLMSERKTLEGTLGLSVIDIPGNKCIRFSCTNGRCRESISLEDTQVIVATDVLSFVAPLHRHEATCNCPTGYSGRLCEIVINQCAYQPCSSYQVCIPQKSDLGYMCECPNSYVGATCSLSKSECLGKESSPKCYTPVAPLSFKGKSFIEYELHMPIERHFSFSVWIRTLYPAGNVLFTSGHLDYSILELIEGHLQFRWDLGSGEGIVNAASLRVDDGLWHHVALERISDTVFLRVDGKHRSEGASPGSSEILNLGSSHLFLGAEMHTWAGNKPRHGFVGCLDDPRVGNAPLPLTQSPSNGAASLLRLSHATPHCYGPMQSPGLCGSHPCLNGGTCEEVDNSYVCECDPRFRGAQCEIDSNPCASSPCINKGRCVNRGNSFRCECPARVSGVRCQFMYCNPNPCLNNGVCEEGISGPICKCSGFTGSFCNVDVNECEKTPCERGGTCINTYGGFKCMCPANLTGIYCDIPNAVAAFPIGFQEIIYIVIGVMVIILVALIIVLTMHCRDRQLSRIRRRRDQQNHVALNCKLNENIFNKHSKLSNIEASQATRPDPISPREPSFVTLNNFDTIRSYGSAGDELENLPQYSREFVHNITKPSIHHNQNRNPSMSRSSSGLTMAHHSSYSPSEPESTHHKVWKDALANNFKDAYYEAGKIQNDVKFNQSEYINLRKLEGGGVATPRKLEGGGVATPSQLSPRDDSSVRSGASLEDDQEYHWDCSDWARPSQNPLPNILEVPGVEVRDSSSYHSNESNESIIVNDAIRALANIMPMGSPVDPRRDIETLAVDETFSDCGTDFDLSSRPDLDISLLDNGMDSDTSLFMPQPSQRYESHPNEYLPRYQLTSEAETDDERSRLINLRSPYRRQQQPSFVRSAVSSKGHSPPSQLRKRLSDLDLEGISSFGNASSDIENVCDFEDSEVNSEFEN